MDAKTNGQQLVTDTDPSRSHCYGLTKREYFALRIHAARLGRVSTASAERSVELADRLLEELAKP
jgi:hypothetical protein